MPYLLPQPLAVWWQSLRGLAYPHLCLACYEHAPQPDKAWCVGCELAFPLTDYHLVPHNELYQLFVGRVSVTHAAAMLRFTVKGAVQHLVHLLKYKGEQGVGVALGRHYGAMLANTPFAKADLLIPVPLHPRKLQLRGYNQSECFAQGLSEALRMAVDTRSFVRVQHTTSQTRKTRAERHENVKSAFAVADAAALQGKHLLLVDDVVTTGATLEACIALLNAIPDTRVSVLCIATAAFV